MNVTGGNGELSEPVGGGDYLLIYVLKLACIPDSALSYKECVVAVGLYIEIVIERGDLQNFIVGFSVEHGSVNLSLLAGTADNYTLAELLDYRARNAGLAAEIFEI